ncbi:Subtilisin-like protease SBT5.3 [Linum perenne]
MVYLGRHSHIESVTANSVIDADQMSDTYSQLLSSFMPSQEKAKEAIFYSYSSHINGFAAMLEDDEVEKLSDHPDVVAVIPNRLHRLHTTRTWAFMGLEDSITKNSTLGKDVIIANIDTGVWPESPSFNCTVAETIPHRWKGTCDKSEGFKCNKKLIGARSFNKGFDAANPNQKVQSNSARDTEGHGSHTLSTAAGCRVPGANLLGSAYGTAKGGSPNAWVASYKACVSANCADADIAAGFDDAIQDGVEVLSISLGSILLQDYYADPISVISFHAVLKGISVVCSGGNFGPGKGTVENFAPWVITVAASTVDREFQSNVVLGDGNEYKGISFNTNTMPAEEMHPLINAVDAKLSQADYTDAKYCLNGTLDQSKVKGKIVVCSGDNVDIRRSKVVLEAGGIGVVIVNTPGFEADASPEAHYLPASLVSVEDGRSISSYISATKSPIALIRGGTVTGKSVTAPRMASFSSQGPNPLTPEILKPDVTAPGVNILAAYTEAQGPADPSDTRHLPFNIVSGTSMSAPHVAGIVGLIRSLYPHWSPAAIKSAIMTTAVTKNNKGHKISTWLGEEATPFDHGAGHVSPSHAMDPGLVYDMTATNYVDFLCFIGYDAKKIEMFYPDPYKCPEMTAYSLSNLNYPSITVPELVGAVTLNRTLKNVGNPSVYTVSVVPPRGISVTIQPSSLEFIVVDEEKSFKILLEAEAGKFDSNHDYVYGELNWSDGTHNVRSPIVVRLVQ